MNIKSDAFKAKKDAVDKVKGTMKKYLEAENAKKEKMKDKKGKK